jgi:serine/threonine-protein kinase HipA
VTTLHEVEVWLDDRGAEPLRAGILRASFQGGRTLASSSFEYDASFLAHRDRYALSPDLPLVAGRQFAPENHALFGAFSDAAPDDWGRRIIDADHAVRLSHDAALPRRIGDFDYLLGVSDRSRSGALRLRDPRTEEWVSANEGVANLHDVGRVVAAAARYESNQATPDDVAYLNDVATSPGGARPKANVLKPDGRLALAKLPRSVDGALDVERWEALALTLATRCGIRVPVWELLPTPAGEKSVLVLDRFDRTVDGQRIGYISGATALGLGVHDDRRVTYEEFADTIGELSVDPRADLREMFTRIALTVLIHNVDDHWRNHGFLRTTQGWRLSPAFDLNPSPRAGSILSRPISSSDDPRNRDIRKLVEVARSFGLARADGVDIVHDVASRVASWRDAAERLGIPDSEQEAMAAAFDPGALDIARSIARTPPESPSRPPATRPLHADLEFPSKREALQELGRLLGREYALGPGSTLPSALFSDAAERAGVAAERVALAAGLTWASDHDSRSTPSGGGSTVTLIGLHKLIAALRALDR